MGETVDALSEWVISTNYSQKNNPASRYLEDVHSNKGQLESLNQTIKKFNQALLYCKQGISCVLAVSVVFRRLKQIPSEGKTALFSGF